MAEIGIAIFEYGGCCFFLSGEEGGLACLVEQGSDALWFQTRLQHFYKLRWLWQLGTLDTGRKANDLHIRPMEQAWVASTNGGECLGLQSRSVLTALHGLEKHGLQLQHMGRNWQVLVRSI